MKYLLSILFVLTSIGLSAQTKYTILSQNDYGITLDIQFPVADFRLIQTPIGDAYTIHLTGATAILAKGMPNLPKVTLPIIIPSGKKAIAEIISTTPLAPQQIAIAPSKGKIYRNQSPNTIPFTYDKIYQDPQAIYPSNILSMGQPYFIRSILGQTLHIVPFQYSPFTQTLQGYSAMRIRITFVHNNEAITENVHEEKIPEVFDAIYSNHFINYITRKSRYSPLLEKGSLLVICPALYLPYIQSYITWKKQKGYQTYIVNTDTIVGGVNETTIANTVKQYYANHRIAYVTLVGDHANVPAMMGVSLVPNLMGPSDNAYGYISNNDHYPEIIVGRLSANTIDDIQTQIQKIIMYEKFPQTASNWMNYQIGVGSDQGPGDDNQMDYEHLCEIMDSNKNYYTYVNQQGYFDGNQSTFCNDDAGYPVPADITQAFNNGLGLMNYCGHGSTTAFSTTGFSTADVSGLNNTQGKWPFIFSTACNNGEFMFMTCLAEGLLRARNSNNEPTGAVAALMSTILQSWDPPMEGQDEMNAIIRGNRSLVPNTTFGGIVANGNMSIMDKYNTFSSPQDGDEIADTWTIFGDPTLEIMTTAKGAIQCSHSSWIQQQSTTAYIGCSVDGATVSAYYQNELWATGKVSGGSVQLNFPALTVLDSIHITATKQNYTPYQGKIDVVNYPLNTPTLKATNIQVFPNPVVDVLHINLPSTLHDATIRITDMSGKLIYTDTIHQIQNQVAMGHLSHGIYQIQIQSNLGSEIFKVVK